MKITITSTSGKHLGTWIFSRNRKNTIESFLQHLFDTDNKKGYDKVRISMNGLEWTFDKIFFEVLWKFIYETYQLQCKINETEQQNVKKKRNNRK